MTSPGLPATAPFPPAPSIPARHRSRRGPLHGPAVDVVAIGSLYLAGCSGDVQAPVVVFAHSVSSADHQSDSVSMWTRITTGVGVLQVDWQVASDPEFKTVVARGRAVTDIARGFVVQVKASGLQPATRYWYRFEVGHQRSPVGRTVTLAADAMPSERIAVACCSN